MERDVSLLRDFNVNAASSSVAHSHDSTLSMSQSALNPMPSFNHPSQHIDQDHLRVNNAHLYASNDSHVSSMPSHSRDVMLSSGNDHSLFEDILSSSSQRSSTQPGGSLLAPEHDFNSEGGSQESALTQGSSENQLVSNETLLHSNPCWNTGMNATRCSEWRVEHFSCAPHELIFEEEKSFSDSNIFQDSDLELIAQENDIVIVNTSKDSRCSVTQENTEHTSAGGKTRDKVIDTPVRANITQNDDIDYFPIPDPDHSVFCPIILSSNNDEDVVDSLANNTDHKRRMRSDSSSPLSHDPECHLPDLRPPATATNHDSATVAGASRVFYKPSVIIHHRAESAANQGIGQPEVPAKGSLTPYYATGSHVNERHGMMDLISAQGCGAMHGAENQYWMTLCGLHAIDMNNLFSVKQDQSRGTTDASMIPSRENHSNNASVLGHKLIKQNVDMHTASNCDAVSRNQSKSKTQFVDRAKCWKPPPLPTRVIKNIEKCSVATNLSQKQCLTVPTEEIFSKQTNTNRPNISNAILQQRERALLDRIEAVENLKKLREDVMVRSHAIEASRIEYFSRKFVEGRERACANRYFDRQLAVLLDWAEKNIHARKYKVESEKGDTQDMAEKTVEGECAKSKKMQSEQVKSHTGLLGKRSKRPSTCVQDDERQKSMQNQSSSAIKIHDGNISSKGDKNLSKKSKRNYHTSEEATKAARCLPKSNRSTPSLSNDQHPESQRQKWIASKSTDFARLLEEDRSIRIKDRKNSCHKVAKNLMNVFDNNHSPNAIGGNHKNAPPQPSGIIAPNDLENSTKVHPSAETACTLLDPVAPIVDPQANEDDGVIISISKLNPGWSDPVIIQPDKHSNLTTDSNRLSESNTQGARYVKASFTTTTAGRRSSPDLSSECNHEKNAQNPPRRLCSPVNYDGFLDTTGKYGGDVFLNADISHDNRKTPTAEQTFDLLSSGPAIERRSSTSSIACNNEKSCELPSSLLNSNDDTGHLKADLSLGFDLMLSNSLQADDNSILLPIENETEVKASSGPERNSVVPENSKRRSASLSRNEFADICFADSSDNESNIHGLQSKQHTVIRNLTGVKQSPPPKMARKGMNVESQELINAGLFVKTTVGSEAPEVPSNNGNLNATRPIICNCSVKCSGLCRDSDKLLDKVKGRVTSNVNQDNNLKFESCSKRTQSSEHSFKPKTQPSQPGGNNMNLLLNPYYTPNVPVGTYIGKSPTEPLIGQPPCLQVLPVETIQQDHKDNSLNIQNVRQIPLADFYMNQMPQPQPQPMPGYVVFKLPPEVVQNMNFLNNGIDAGRNQNPAFNLLNSVQPGLKEENGNTVHLQADDVSRKGFPHQSGTTLFNANVANWSQDESAQNRQFWNSVYNNHLNDIRSGKTHQGDQLTQNSCVGKDKTQQKSTAVHSDRAGQPRLTDQLKSDLPCPDHNNNLNAVKLSKPNNGQLLAPGGRFVVDQNPAMQTSSIHITSPVFTFSSVSSQPTNQPTLPSTHVQQPQDSTNIVLAPNSTLTPEQQQQALGTLLIPINPTPASNQEEPSTVPAPLDLATLSSPPDLAHMEGALKQELYTLIEKINQPGSEVDSAVRVLMHRKSMQHQGHGSLGVAEGAVDMGGGDMHVLSSDGSPRQPRRQKVAKLPTLARRIMERWYEQNVRSPYPSMQTAEFIANSSGISVEQVKKWFANKRMRSGNTRKVCTGSDGQGHQKRPAGYHQLQSIAKRIKHEAFPQEPGDSDNNTS